MAPNSSPKRSLTIPILGLAFVLLYGFVAWMAWQDIAVNLYRYYNPDAVSSMDWFGMVFPGISAIISIVVAVWAWQNPRPWQGRFLFILLFLNIAVIVFLFANFFSGWGGTSFG